MMKRFLLMLLVIFVITVALAGAGFAGYRIGYQQGTLAAPNDNVTIAPFARGNDFRWERMPMDEFRRGLDRKILPRPGFGPGGFGMRLHDRGFGFFSLFRFLVQVAILGLIVWLVYKLLTGWRLSFTRATVESPRVEPVPPVESEAKSNEEQSN